MATETQVAERKIRYPTLQGPIKYGEFHPRDTILETAKAGLASGAVGLVFALAKGNLTNSQSIAGGLRRNLGTAVLFSMCIRCCGFVGPYWAKSLRFVPHGRTTMLHFLF